MNTLSKVVTLGLALAFPALANAVTVTANGTDVDFIYDDASLFGTAIVVGNSLFFQPTSFSAESLNGAGAVSARETLKIDVVVTNPGFNITSLAMIEQGDYVQDGIGASVSASGRLGVTSKTTNCGIFPCNDFSIFNVASFTDTGGTTVDWSGGTSVDLADTASWGSDTDLEISFQNNLSATTENGGEQAFIQKKSGAIGLVVNPVPVPAALWLFGSGLVGLLAASRRRKR